jgi:hypothetical protein
MLNYWDRFKRLHDKPCIDMEPSSNNGWIYLAYALKLGLINKIEGVTMDALNICFREKRRHPHKESVVVSRDEIIAMIYINPSYAKDLIQNDFWMNYAQPIFNFPKFCKQIIDLYKNRKDRNYWHKNNLDQAEFLTMKLPITDRAFIYKQAGLKVPLIYKLVEAVDKKLKPSGRSSAAIRSFKYDLDNNAGIYAYFAADPNHPITQFKLSK